MTEALPVLYTVGHSTHSIGHFIGILKKNKIAAIADVRSSPFSKFTPQFNREALKDALRSEGIKYVFLGDELGARRGEPESYENGKVVFEKVAALPSFLNGVDRLQDGASRMRVAIMCAEKDPLTCHRTVLVSHFARERFADTLHILDDGSIETRKQADDRLLRELKLDMDNFFNPYQERLKIAYSRRALKIAYNENESKAVHG